MLATIAEIAESEGATYFAAYGTALGVERHADIIPWDRDLDLVVPNRNYSSLCDALERNLPEDFILLRPGFPGYEHLFARVAPRNFDQNFLHADLFPLVGAPSSKSGQKIFDFAMHRLWQAYLVKTCEPQKRYSFDARKARIARVLQRVLWAVSATTLLRLHRWLGSFFDYESADVVYNSCGSYGVREFAPKRWFEGGGMGKIGDIEVRIPHHVDLYLTRIYGDYSRLPATAERELLLDLFERLLSS